jgi:sugar phosphate isomerase/epimerase
MNGRGPFGWWPEEDLGTVLSIVRKTGYDGAEIMTNVLTANSAPEIRDRFGAADLSVAAVHVFTEEVASDEALSGILDRVTGVACDRLIVSTGGNRTEEDFRRLAQGLNNMAQRAADRGVALLFHPHQGEFRRIADGDGLRGVDIVAAQTDPDLVGFNVDFFWAYVGETDPVAAVEEFGPRGGYFHVRDGDGRHSSRFGTGHIDVRACLAAVPEDCRWLVYEDPDPSLPPTALCRTSREYIREHTAPAAARRVEG